MSQLLNTPGLFRMFIGGTLLQVYLSYIGIQNSLLGCSQVTQYSQSTYLVSIQFTTQGLILLMFIGDTVLLVYLSYSIHSRTSCDFYRLHSTPRSPFFVIFIVDTVLLVYLSLQVTTPGLLLGMFIGGTVLQESVLGVYFSTLKV